MALPFLGVVLIVSAWWVAAVAVAVVGIVVMGTAGGRHGVAEPPVDQADPWARR